MTEPVLWAKLTWPELQEQAQRAPRMALWPLGTTEQHGRHLPVDVDVRNCLEVALRASAKTGVPIIPPLPFGDSSFWVGWPGTLSLQADTVERVIVDVITGVVETGFRRLILLNGHIGNGPVLRLLENRLRTEFPTLQVRALSWWDVSERVVDVMYADAYEGALRSFHANDGETSVYLTHSPERVQMELAKDELAGAARPVFSYHSRKLTESGVMGEPRRATAARGQEMLDMAVEDLVAMITAAATEDSPPDVWGVAG